MNDGQLLAAFEAGAIDGGDFPHERHLRVAWQLSRRYPRQEALRRLADGIRDIAERAGRPDVYHETITRAWFELIAAADSLECHPELNDKGLLGRYYSAERLAAGRARWLEPDLHPLRLPPPEARPAAVSLPEVLRRIPTPVVVLGARADHTVHAATISSLTSVSREPALVSVCLANGSRTLDLVRRSCAFALSVLAAGQDDLSTRFADPARPAGADQFDGVEHELGLYGPTIDGAAAWLGCHVHAVHGCGDHQIVVGRVLHAQASPHRPLVRHDGTHH